MVVPGRIFTFINMCPITPPTPPAPRSFLIRTGLLAVMTVTLQSQTHFWGRRNTWQLQAKAFDFYSIIQRLDPGVLLFIHLPVSWFTYQLSARSADTGTAAAVTRGCVCRSGADGPKARVYTDVESV